MYLVIPFIHYVFCFLLQYCHFSPSQKTTVVCRSKELQPRGALVINSRAAKEKSLLIISKDYSKNIGISLKINEN